MHDDTTLRIVQATTPQQLDAARGLIRAFVEWHRARHVDDLQLIDAYFDAGKFADELANLPGPYAPPDGRLLLAMLDVDPVGCVALHRLDDGCCEMKRMFVDPAQHGRGIGAALATAVLEQARHAGYRVMRLDTSIRQVEARRLYERLGFQRVAPYYELPPELRDWLVFMERQL